MFFLQFLPNHTRLRKGSYNITIAKNVAFYIDGPMPWTISFKFYLSTFPSIFFPVGFTHLKNLLANVFLAGADISLCSVLRGGWY